MTKLEKRIQELEKRIRELEARPVYVPYPVYTQPYSGYPYQWKSPWWYSAQGIGTAAASGTTVKYDPTIPHTFTS